MPGSYQPPVSSNPHDPFEKFRVEEIQKEQEQNDDSKEIARALLSPRSAFAAYVSLLLKKFLDVFEKTSEQGLSSSAESDILEHITSLKSALEILKEQDRGQDSSFLNNLSDQWHQLLEDVLRFRRKTTLSLKMRNFIMEFQNYPEKQEHTLGYYLTEYAGQKWLPFPYMEMISRLNIQHQKDPESSLLTHWTKSLEEMIQMLKSR